jgi:hypothetical protein
MSTPEGLAIATKVEPVRRNGALNDGAVVKTSGMSLDHRTKLGESIRARAARDPKRIERNQEIIRLYDEDELGMNEVAHRLGIAFKTVANVLHAAAAEGDVVIRRGATGRTRRAIG